MIIKLSFNNREIVEFFRICRGRRMKKIVDNGLSLVPLVDNLTRDEIRRCGSKRVSKNFCFYNVILDFGLRC